MALTGSASKAAGTANDLQGSIESGGVLLGKMSGLKTLQGYSAYEVAVINGFSGTEEEWLATLKGKQGDRGDPGPQGPAGADGTMSFEDLTDEQRESLRGPRGEKGATGDTGDSGVHYGTDTPPEGKNVWIDPSGEATAVEVNGAVRYDETQTLTADQKTQARANIGAASSEEVKSLSEEKVDKLNYHAFGLPVLELTGDVSAMTKDNAVNLAYKYGDRSGTASVKWQGASSLSYPKKNYTIKFDNAFEAVEGWGEQKKYCLKANFIDHSHARNVVSAKLWGQMVKSRTIVPTELADLPNGGAVDGFPCIIMLNGEFHGLYTFNIPKDGWMFGMGSGTKECILCAENSVNGATRFVGTALCDGTDFEIEYITDEESTQWAVDSINTLISAVLASDGSDIDTTIAELVDIDSAIDHLIFTALISGGDNWCKNYLLVTFDGMKWFFSTYDMDSTFGSHWTGRNYYAPTHIDNGSPGVSYIAARHALMDLLAKYKTDAVKARYEELRNSVLSESNVFADFSNFMVGIPSALLSEDVRRWPDIPGSGTSNLAQITMNYTLRTPAIDKEVSRLICYTPPESVDAIWNLSERLSRFENGVTTTQIDSTTPRPISYNEYVCPANVVGSWGNNNSVLATYEVSGNDFAFTQNTTHGGGFGFAVPIFVEVGETYKLTLTSDADYRAYVCYFNTDGVYQTGTKIGQSTIGGTYEHTFTVEDYAYCVLTFRDNGTIGHHAFSDISIEKVTA